MAVAAAARLAAERIFAAFRAAGALPVETDILQPAEVLLDLYGEDIRARAYVTRDPLQGEMMLRPDFTVPVAQMHMATGAGPARYCYLGKVFRKQEHLKARPSEFLQVGYEVFDGLDIASADAEVFALFADLLAPLGLVAVTGDIGVLMAAVRGLTTTEARKSALLRQIWRPHRFKALLERFGQSALVRPPAPATAAPAIGLRSAAEVAERLAALDEDARAAPLAAEEVALLDDIMDLHLTARAAHERLREIAAALPAVGPAVDRFAARLDALARRGVDTEALDFEASHGRTALEYYDGFVFSFHAPGADLPPIASGGRYDALTAVLGQGRRVPAVGGVVRPDLVARLGGIG